MMAKPWVLTLFAAALFGAFGHMRASKPESQQAQQPEVVSAVAPIFPPVAVGSRTSGVVRIEVIVGANGTVSAAQIIDGPELLQRVVAVTNTARRWRFAPASDTKQHRVALTFGFRLMPRETPPVDLTPVFMPPYHVEVRHTEPEPIVQSDPPATVRDPAKPRKPRTQ